MNRMCMLLLRGFFVVRVMATIAGCGGGGGDDDPAAVTPPPSASATIGAMGGLLAGPDGVSLEVPPGALASDVVITIARDATGAPARIEENSIPIYAITPHGLHFAVPATLRYPATLVPPSDQQKVLLKAQPGGAWESFALVRQPDGSLAAQLPGLSLVAVSDGGFASIARWVDPAPGVAERSRFNERLVTQPTRVKVRFDATAFSRCGGTLTGGIQMLQMGLKFGDLWTPIDEQSTTVAIDSGQSTTHDFEFDITPTAQNNYYTFVPVGRCLNLKPGNPNDHAASGPPQEFPTVHTRSIAPPVIVQQPVDVRLNGRIDVTFKIVATAPAPGTLELTWESSNDGGATWTATDIHSASIAYQLNEERLRTRWRVRVCNLDGSGMNCIFSNVVRTIDTSFIAPWQEDSLVAGNGTMSMAISASKTLWTWGSSNGGSLGRSDPANGPREVTAFRNVRSAAAGAWHASALLDDGTVYAWGWGPDIGDAIGSTALDNPTPTRVPALSRIRALADRYGHVLALDELGNVWGFGPEETLAIGPVLGHHGVRQVRGVFDVRQVAAGDAHSLALDEAGDVWAWGDNGEAQLGVTGSGSGVPQRVPGLQRIVAIAATSHGSFALNEAGELFSWGRANQIGRDGDPSAPARVTGLPGIARIAAGHYAAWALPGDGSVWGWGENGDQGIAGIGSTAPVVGKPVPLDLGVAPVKQMAGGEFHGLALRENGEVWTWGSNGNWQLEGADGPGRPAPAPSGFDRSR